MTNNIPSNLVLVIDSEPLTRVAVVEAMQEYSSHPPVDWAGDANTARVMLRRKPYSLVLLDEQVPGIISRDFAHSVHHTSPQTRVILMDESGSAEVRETAARWGFDGHLCKPFTVREICDVVDGVDKAMSEKQSYAGVNRQAKPVAQSEAANASRNLRGMAPLHGLGLPGHAPLPPASAPTAAVPPSARESLESLWSDTRARCVLLITTSGYPVDAVGQTRGLHLPTLGALIAANFAAAAELSRLLGNPADFRASHHQGPDSQIYTYKASQELLLAVIFGEESRAGAVWLFAKRAAATLGMPPILEPPTVESEGDLDAQMEVQWADLLNTGANHASSGPVPKAQKSR
jgi:DNA-binding NarL/FixJ family response regulator/predicted regulator of Ras-like GTPase activity (Roadblock/LC7/MglB family)